MSASAPWTPDRDAAIRAIIEQTISATGDVDAGELPHRLKAALKSHVTEGPDLDALVEKILKEERSKAR